VNVRKSIAAWPLAAILAIGATSVVVAASPGAGDRIPIVTEFGSPCTGEVLLVEGTLHGFPPGGNNAAGHSDFHGTATSESGTTYIFMFVSAAVVERGPGNATFTFVQPLVFIATGEAATGDDFLVTFVFHVTTDAEGNPVATVLIMNAVCL
jgi:hypothetical protein